MKLSSLEHCELVQYFAQLQAYSFIICQILNRIASNEKNRQAQQAVLFKC